MSDKDITCTVNGMRPHKLPVGMHLDKLLKQIECEIRQSLTRGYALFLSGMAMGVDIWAAQIIIKLKKEFPNIRLICYQPCETQASRWTVEWRKTYFDVLAQSDEVICLQGNYSAGCMQRRNLRMIDGSSRLITVYDGVTKGGTAHTIGYAQNQGVDIIQINPLHLAGLIPCVGDIFFDCSFNTGRGCGAASRRCWRRSSAHGKGENR